MQIMTSPDSKRSVTLSGNLADLTPQEIVAGGGHEIVPDPKRPHVVCARTASGALRTWQVSSAKYAGKIVTAYRRNGGSAVRTVSLF